MLNFVEIKFICPPLYALNNKYKQSLNKLTNIQPNVTMMQLRPTSWPAPRGTTLISGILTKKY